MFLSLILSSLCQFQEFKRAITQLPGTHLRQNSRGTFDYSCQTLYKNALHSSPDRGPSRNIINPIQKERAMKSASRISLFIFLMLCFALTISTGAITDGPSASGSFQVSVDNGTSRQITFHASSAGDGSTTGEITFRDLSKASAQRAVVDQALLGADPTFYAKAECDCLKINGVEAVLSGTVTESSREDYVGRRVLLMVQDGDSLTPALRDKLTWGFYRSTAKNWVATDAERPEEGPATTWVATDAERPEDTGQIPQKSDEVNCESFPISSYSFVGAKYGRGKIEVRR